MKPRNVAGAVVRGADFWGREEDTQRLWGLLERGSVLLSAPRRHGKSSIMSRLRDEPNDGWAVSYLDVEYVESPEQFLTELATAVLSRGLVRTALRGAKNLSHAFAQWTRGLIENVELPAGELGSVKIALRDRLESSPEWSELAGELLDQIALIATDTLIIVDEFPMMVGTFIDTDQANAISFLRWFRAQRQKDSRTRFLLGGSVNIEPRLEILSQSALLNDLDRYVVRPFSRDKATLFVEAVLIGEGMNFEKGVPEEIVRVAETGVPFFLQVIISECLSEAHNSEQEFAAAQVEPIYLERVLGPSNRGRFSHYHTRLKEYGKFEGPARLVLSEVALSGTCSTAQLEEVLTRGGFSDCAVDRLLSLLEGDYYLFRDGDQLSYPSRFLRDWWLRNAPTVRGRS